MAHLPGISAVYQVHDSSGVHHEKAGPRQPHTRKLSTKKWSPRWDEEQWMSMMERNWAFPDLENALAESQQHAAQSLL